MYKEQDKQTSFFGNLVYGRIIPQGHLLRKLNEIIDFSFVNDLCKDLYCQDNGRPCWEPQVIFKMALLQYLYDLSDAVIEEETRDRLSFKWFLGLDADAEPPDATTLVRFRERLGHERFAEIFNSTVKIARQNNLINDKLHIVDATAVKAKVDTWRIKKEQDNNKKGNDQTQNKNDYIERNSPDKDARIGHTSATKTVYGYKGYIQMDRESEIIVSTTVDSANKQESEHLKELIDQANAPEKLLTDKAYDTNYNHSLLESRGIVSGIIKRKIRRGRNGNYYLEEPQTKNDISNLAKLRSAVEHKIAELKRWHHLSHARFLGLAKMRIQMFLTCIAVNVKRMVKLISQNLSPPFIKSVANA